VERTQRDRVTLSMGLKGEDLWDEALGYIRTQSQALMETLSTLQLGITRGVVEVHRLSVDRYNDPLMASVVVFICFLCSRSSSMVM
jgi:hypothetical protein